MNVSLSSLALNQIEIKSTIDTAVLNMSLEAFETTGDSLIKLMELSINPNLGQNIDIKI